MRKCDCGSYAINIDEKRIVCDVCYWRLKAEAADKLIEVICDIIPELQRSLKAAEAKYHELLYAVEHKFPDETRHETALRYIRERESAELGPAQEQTK